MGGAASRGVERVVPLEEAERRARLALAALGLRPELTAHRRDGVEPTAWSCRLVGAGGETAPAGIGMGKGGDQEARVGALFEALEHHLTGPASLRPDRIVLCPGRELAAGPLADDATAPLLAALGPLACHPYAPTAGRGGTAAALPLPLFLSSPWYVDDPEARAAAGDPCDYTHLARYSSNSGSAIGVTEPEALLHALNEAVERDAFSLLLVHAFLRPGGFAPPVVDPATLPARLARAHRRAEHLTGGPVHLLDITTDLGVPTYMAYAPPTPHHPHRRGAGTSLSPRYAAWRALAEFVQGVLARPEARERAVLDGLAAHPALLACGRFDLTRHLARARPIPFPPAEEPPGPPAAQLRRLTRLLTAAGHPPYHRVTAALPGGITAVHAHVLGLERFMLVTDGMLVLPGARARRVDPRLPDRAAHWS
ncbi:ribosomal protein S12 methylthiotransferase accessory factor [Thermocatellispora tengchongensis]|uniref:Ribosomal protein S12 methylthiotransferase accessory factor n=1 Tax=Thermocatellispora tengchongensis TaxID=1073253 RepID=A0A840P3P6_9ACTN|nr:YcaO-like family protein [Thermocatellispora tengchongensis]MBB5133609.1 ribosomal protein S12 methylthiotransferase accessory factor [Thermocatellispora tengchongensis]